VCRFHKHLQSSLSLLSWSINLGILTEGKLAATLIIPSSWGSQWAGHSARTRTYCFTPAASFLVPSPSSSSPADPYNLLRFASVCNAMSGTKFRFWICASVASICNLNYWLLVIIYVLFHLLVQSIHRCKSYWLIQNSIDILYVAVDKVCMATHRWSYSSSSNDKISQKDP
jgi:hypothetical protein